MKLNDIGIMKFDGIDSMKRDGIDSMKLNDGERIDEMGFSGLRIIQRPEDFCYGVDAVILAGEAAGCSKRAGRIADICSGNGAVALMLSHKTSAEKIIAVELQEVPAELAVRNAELNGLQDRISVICGDVKDISGSMKETIDMVVMNPPYIAAGAGIENTDPVRHAARHETTADLKELLAAAAEMLVKKGDMYMIHRPSRLADIFISARDCGLEPKEMRMISPSEGRAPNLVTVHMVKGGGSGLIMLPELHVYTGAGDYSEDILGLYEKI